MNNMKDCNKSISKKDNNEYTKYNIYNINKDNLEYKVEIGIKNDNIIFKIMDYQLNLNKEDFINLINIQFETIEDIFIFINTKFANQQININNITNKNLIKLIIELNEEKTKNLELFLINKNINKDFIINELCNNYNNNAML